ncbi:DEKNAAC100900 [Brettanomyces naardenensis]|uniref:DEKNAAC100900 n=1 Tax=Brettanomyces naardenensis TaxID=13370 RepID=A0A448YEQ3_BRENA|nr:DEKNAAC100900 [Brettanomyces naardenensis]
MFSAIVCSLWFIVAATAAKHNTTHSNTTLSYNTTYHPGNVTFNHTLTYDVPFPAQTVGLNASMYEKYEIYHPKVFVINMFSLEQEPFMETFNFTHNITIPGLSPVYPEIHCTKDYSLCQVTTGEGEINAAVTITSLSTNPSFDLSQTFFIVAGIAGCSPKQATLADVTFSHFVVQILEYEVDSRELPSNWTTGYFPFGTENSTDYPENIYGTEIFELNLNLRDRALKLAQSAKLDNGTKANEAFRETFDYAPANSTPKAIGCDTLTSDTYWFGQDFDETFANYTSLITNGTATYCTTQEEDSATMEALIRAARFGLVDFSRVVVMRTCSDFTYSDEYTGNETTYFFDDVSQGGISASLTNLVIGSKPLINDILKNFEIYNNGTYAPTNYIGDYFNSLEFDVDVRTWGNAAWGTA